MNILRSSRPLIILSLILLTCRSGWLTFEYFFGKSDSSVKNCVCTCVDPQLSISHGLQTLVQYTGTQPSTNSCSCHEFFIPKIHDYMETINVHSVCEVCDCDYEKNNDSDISLTYQDLCDVILMTVVGVTLVLILHEWMQNFNKEISRHYMEDRRRRRLLRTLRNMREYVSQNAETENELTRYPETVRLNINESPNGTRNSQGYQTFNPEH